MSAAIADATATIWAVLAIAMIHLPPSAVTANVEVVRPLVSGSTLLEHWR
jgi:hypothetical protein